MSKKSNTSEFILKAKHVHGNLYDYSKVDYKDNKTKICIICPIHGEFWQRPDKHLKGQGCPICGGTKKSDKETFISSAKKIHGDKYDYSKVVYVNNNTKVCITCPEHGDFWQDPHNHLKGKGCPICGKSIFRSKKYTTEQFINEAKKIHGDKYDYSKTEYLLNKTKLCITCPEHGDFWQVPYLHLSGCGCPDCAVVQNSDAKRKLKEDFIKEANKIHDNKYDYSQVEYKNGRDKIKIICPEHGEFWQAPFHHLQGNGCPKCVHHTSKAETEIYDFIKSIVGADNVKQSVRNIIPPKEIDIYIPSLKIGIEYNGLYFHQKNIRYHIDKTNACKQKGIKLIQIFEDEYRNHKDIVLSKLSHILGKCDNLPKIMGRKCEIKEIKSQKAKVFLNKNHIQGFGGGSVYLGAFYNEQLIAVMAFKNDNNGKWELTRFASDNNYVSQGLGGKLFSFFVKHYNPIEIKSFADRRWTINEDNNLYIQLGFKFDSYTPPEYRYFKPEDGIIRQHKFNFRKEKLNKKYGLPLTMTETEMTEKLGYKKIYDCGLIKYVWTKKKEV